MIFDLRPHNVAGILAVIFAIPVFWVLVVQGVTTTTEFDLQTGEYSSSSDLWTQIGKVIVFTMLAGACVLAERYLRSNDTRWSHAIREKLAKVVLAESDSAPPSTSA